eukprot:TRINITY_DN4172_c0_g2_i2.p1 TRINITY_DN4172_c0_g2~~TRINITY_DN4172_c0_g2_i2.p1  ORF type:complete len:406 (+),score=4.78 TRINITY_DN4172_c0_g2_i2:175-1392(+)
MLNNEPEKSREVSSLSVGESEAPEMYLSSSNSIHFGSPDKNEGNAVEMFKSKNERHLNLLRDRHLTITILRSGDQAMNGERFCITTGGLYPPWRDQNVSKCTLGRATNLCKRNVDIELNKYDNQIEELHAILHFGGALNTLTDKPIFYLLKLERLRLERGHRRMPLEVLRLIKEFVGSEPPLLGIEDAGTRNGTFVKLRAAKEYQLTLGTQINVGCSQSFVVQKIDERKWFETLIFAGKIIEVPFKAKDVIRVSVDELQKGLKGYKLNIDRHSNHLHFLLLGMLDGSAITHYYVLWCTDSCGGSFIIGRSRADILIENQEISRHHCTIRYNPEISRWVIYDGAQKEGDVKVTQSLNGTWMDSRVRGADSSMTSSILALESGDQIKIGSDHLELLTFNKPDPTILR